MKAILGASILSLLLLTVWEHSEMVQIGYEIEQMKREKLHQHKRQQALLVEYYELVSLNRIEQFATTHLGLVWPQPGQVVLISHP
jgi:cell division protein FtsL